MRDSCKVQTPDTYPVLPSITVNKTLKRLCPFTVRNQDGGHLLSTSLILDDMISGAAYLLGVVRRGTGVTCTLSRVATLNFGTRKCLETHETNGTPKKTLPQYTWRSK